MNFLPFFYTVNFVYFLYLCVLLFTSQTPFIFACFGVVTTKKYFIWTKNDWVMDPKNILYLQKDSLEHLKLLVVSKGMYSFTLKVTRHLGQFFMLHFRKMKHYIMQAVSSYSFFISLFIYSVFFIYFFFILLPPPDLCDIFIIHLSIHIYLIEKKHFFSIYLPLHLSIFLSIYI